MTAALSNLFLAIGNLLAEADRENAGQEQAVSALTEPVGNSEQLPNPAGKVAETLPPLPSSVEKVAETPANSVVKVAEQKPKWERAYPNTCQSCGAEFKATTRAAKYCPECRAREKTKNIKAAHAKWMKSLPRETVSFSPREDADMIYGNSTDM